MTLTWEGEEGREVEGRAKAGDSEIREVKAEGGREGLRGLKARPGRDVWIRSAGWRKGRRRLLQARMARN